MINHPTGISAFLFLVCLLYVKIPAIDISGTVKNQAKRPVGNLEVALKGLGFKDTTDAAGAFCIRQLTGITFHERRWMTAPKPRGYRFVVPVTSGNQKVSLDLFDLKGSRVATVIDMALPRGEHAVPLVSAGAAPASVLIAVLRRDSDITGFRIVQTGGGGLPVHEFSGGTSGYPDARQTAASPALDSLLFIRRITVEGRDTSFNEFEIPVVKWTDKFEVTLDLVPYEAVEWGKTQVGRGDEDVGRELKDQAVYPFELYRYSKGTAWCSEFYSYVLRIGGYPLGDDAGGATTPHWLVNGWDKLITWFKNNAVYIEKSQIDAQNFIPSPGDFVQMYEHATIVRYVKGTTLYTLGGNEGDGVCLARRGNYKSFPGLNGYGKRSGVRGDSYKSVWRR